MKIGSSLKNNEFRIGSVDIGLEIVAVAVARVCGRPSRRDKKGFKDVDVYNPHAKLIISVRSRRLTDVPPDECYTT